QKLLDRTIEGLPPESTGSLWRRKAFYARDRGDTRLAMAALDASPMRNSGLAGLNFEIAHLLVLDRRYDEATALINSLEDVARAHNALPKSGINPFARGEYDLELGIIARGQGQ